MEKSEIKDAAGGTANRWGTYGVRWAYVKSLSGSEIFEGGINASKGSFKLELRYDPKITSKMGVVVPRDYQDVKMTITAPPENQGETNTSCEALKDGQEFQ